MTPAFHYQLSAFFTFVVNAFLVCWILKKNGLASGLSRRFVFYCSAIAAWAIFVWICTISKNYAVAYFFGRLTHIAAALIPVFFLQFVLLFLGTHQKPFEKRSLLIAYAVELFFITLLVIKPNLILGQLSHKLSFPWFPDAGILYTPWMASFFIVVSYTHLLILLALFKTHEQRRKQLRFFFTGNLIGYIGGIGCFLPVYSLPIFPFPYGAYGVVLFTLVTTYAIIQYRFMDVNLAITRTAVFMAVYAAILGLPLFGALTYQDLLEKNLGHRWWVYLLVGYAGLTTAAHYINLYFQRRAEDRLLVEQRRYQSVLRQASQGMVSIKDLDKLLRLIVHLLTQKVRIKHAAVYLWEPQVKKFVLSASRQWPVKEAAPSFPEDHPLVEYIHWNRKAIVSEELQMQVRSGEKNLQSVVSSMRVLQAAVLVPSFTEDRCEGFLLLGDKISDKLFTPDDLQVFEVLASQAALAIQNAQFYEELKRTQTDLFQTAKMASLGHMAGGMSHQINNRFHVLTILAGTLKSVMKDSDPSQLPGERLKELWGKAVETLGKLEDNAVRGGDIVKTLLRFSRPAGEYKAVTMAQILATAKEVSQFRINISLVDIIEQVPGDIPPVRGDLNQLADSCFNLLTNAYDAIQKKGTMIQSGQISPSPNDPVPFRGKIVVRVYMEKKDDQPTKVVLEIQDNGTGMMASELDSLFIPFFTTKATAQKGTGLGLYVIQRIVEQHGGSIKAASKYGAGTTFIMRLPVFEGGVPA